MAKASLWERSTRLTVQPPKPPPVRRAPKQPGRWVAVSTRKSTSSQLHCEVVALAGVAGEHELAEGDGVAGEHGFAGLRGRGRCR